MKLTLPTDSQERKAIPIVSGCLDYFPAALAGVARISKQGNDKHNPGQHLHHARGKSNDHADCIVRHLMDLQDLLAYSQRVAELDCATDEHAILTEVSALAWRSLALSQELHERFGAPLAPGARLPAPVFVVPPLTEAEEREIVEAGPGDIYAAVVSEAQRPAHLVPLQLEVGKRYVRRDGNVSGPLEVNTGYDKREFKFLDPEFFESYRENGTWAIDKGVETHLDLLREYWQPGSQPASTGQAE